MNFAVLLAGGHGRRMECSNKPKQYINIAGKSILEYTLDAFSSVETIDGILLVIDAENFESSKRIASRCTKPTWCTCGGSTRNLSVLCGIKFLAEKCHPSKKDKIIVSDGVRPCVFKSEILNLLSALDKYDCATTALECYETLLTCTANGEIEDIVPRDHLFRQTSPEAYRFSQLEDLYLCTSKEDISHYKNIGLDQLHAIGCSIGIVPSSPLNFKVTKQ